MHLGRSFTILFLVLVSARAASAEPGELEVTASPKQTVRLTAEQLFALADGALTQSDIATAEIAYRALARNPKSEIRFEAQFRLGMVLSQIGRHDEAAGLFRKILDEKPGAQRVKLELARVLDQIGDEAGARRALREVQAGGLPPDVARFVDRYSAALRSHKPLGASFELAFAPDSNINRATRSDTLGTVLGDFSLDEDSKETSGVGLALRGQIYGRLKIGDSANLMARVSGAADFFRRFEFNDLALGVTAGPEFQLGQNRLTAEAGLTWRSFGGLPFSITKSLALNYLHPLDRRSQVHGTASVGETDNKRNNLQDGQSYNLSFGYERALSNRAGAGITITGDRQQLRNSGYSTASLQVAVFGYREMGTTTFIGSFVYGHLEADERQFIYPTRRKDNLFRATLGATFRQFSVGQFAPLVRVILERNVSSIEIFNYRRLRTEVGITRAF